jgi:hypothetical protein
MNPQVVDLVELEILAQVMLAVLVVVVADIPVPS